MGNFFTNPYPAVINASTYLTLPLNLITAIPQRKLRSRRNSKHFYDFFYKDDDVAEEEEEDNYASRKLMIRQMQVRFPIPDTRFLSFN